jgi:hypothetical protein
MLWSAPECFGVYEYMYYGMHTTLGRGGIHCSDSGALVAFWSMFRYSKSFGCTLQGCSDRPENPHTSQRFAYEPEHFHVLPSICMYSRVKILRSTYKYSGGTLPCYSIAFHPTPAYSTYSMPFHLILLLWPIACYSGPFHTTPTHCMLLQPIQHYSMLLRPIACYSNPFHFIPHHPMLLWPIQSNSGSFHATPAHSSLFCATPTPSMLLQHIAC